MEASGELALGEAGHGDPGIQGPRGPLGSVDLGDSDGLPFFDGSEEQWPAPGDPTPEPRPRRRVVEETGQGDPTAPQALAAKRTRMPTGVHAQGLPDAAPKDILHRDWAKE